MVICKRVKTVGMKISSRKLFPSYVSKLKNKRSKQKGSSSINQLYVTSNVSVDTLSIGDAVRIHTLGDSNWTAWGGDNPAEVGDEFILTSVAPRDGTVDVTSLQIDFGCIPGTINTYDCWILLYRVREYDGATLNWTFWWIPYSFLTTMNEITITTFMVPSGGPYVIDDVRISGPSINNVTNAYPSDTPYYGEDFPASTLDNELFDALLLAELGIVRPKSFFMINVYDVSQPSLEYEGSLGDYMRGQKLFSFIDDYALSTDYTNYSGVSPYETSFATFYNYNDVQTGSSNAVLIIVIVFLILVSAVFAFFAFYPRGNRVSRFA